VAQMAFWSDVDGSDVSCRQKDPLPMTSMIWR